MKRLSYNKSDLENHIGIWLWIENESGEILMQYHKKFACWTIPLEKADPGEVFETAVFRAGLEELGIKIQDYKVAHTQVNKYIRDGVEVRVKGSLIFVKKYEGTPMNMEPDKHSALDWKSKDFIKKLESEMDAVKSLQKHI